MSTPAISTPPAAPVPVAVEHRALRAAPAWSILWLVTITAIIAWWRLAPLMDEALVATVFLTGTTWWLINAGSRHASRCGLGLLVVTTCAGLLLLRLLQVASPVDFWILRLAQVLLLPAAAMVVGGAGCVWPALPGWLALVLWLAWPNMGWLQRLDAGDGVSSFTAMLAGKLLGLLGYATREEGHSIWLKQIRVDVLTPCTCLPLIQALLKTLLPGALLLRLTLRRTLALALAIGPVAFVVSVLRCALLVIVAPEPERFHYWHGLEGASIFTAVALGLIGWGMVYGARAPAWLAQPVPLATASRASRPALGLIALASIFAWWGQPASVPLSVPIAWQPPPGWSLVSHHHSTWLWSTTATDKPLTQCDEWVVDTPAGRVRYLLGYAPVQLGGDAASLVYLQGFDPQLAASVQGVALPGIGPPVASWADASGRWWVTLAAGDGVAHSSPASWSQWLHGQRWSPTHWGRLVAGQGPLLDKRALWIAVAWPEAQAGKPEAQAITVELIRGGLEQAKVLLSAVRVPTSSVP